MESKRQPDVFLAEFPDFISFLQITGRKVTVSEPQFTREDEGDCITGKISYDGSKKSLGELKLCYSIPKHDKWLKERLEEAGTLYLYPGNFEKELVIKSYEGRIPGLRTKHGTVPKLVYTKEHHEIKGPEWIRLDKLIVPFP